MFVDHRSDFGNFLRKPLSYPADAVHYVANFPGAITAWVGGYFSTTSDLREENRRLERQALILRQNAQRVAVLEAENVRLRELLNSSARIDARVDRKSVV